MQKKTSAELGMKISGMFTLFGMAFFAAHMEKMIWVMLCLGLSTMYFAVIKFREDKKAGNPDTRSRDVMIISFISVILMAACAIAIVFM